MVATQRREEHPGCLRAGPALSRAAASTGTPAPTHLAERGKPPPGAPACQPSRPPSAHPRGRGGSGRESARPSARGRSSAGQDPGPGGHTPVSCGETGRRSRGAEVSLARSPEAFACPGKQRPAVRAAPRAPVSTREARGPGVPGGNTRRSLHLSILLPFGSSPSYGPLSFAEHRQRPRAAFGFLKCVL